MLDRSRVRCGNTPRFDLRGEVHMGANLLFNTLVVGLGVTGAVLAMRQVVRRGTTEGVSLSSQVGLLFSCAGWTTFGLFNADVPQIAANAVTLAAILPVLWVGRT